MAYTAPVIMDTYARYRAGVFDQHNYVADHVGLQSFFGNPASGSETVISMGANAVDIEIIKANQRTAALRPRQGITGRVTDSAHKTIRQAQWSSFTRTFPLIEDEGSITADMLQFRAPTEGVYDNMDPVQRARIHAMRIFTEAMRRTIRTNERLASQSLATGKQSAQDLADTTVNIYDFRRNSSNIITPSHGWGNAAGVPLTDLDTGINQALATGRALPRGALMGATAMAYLLANPQLITNQYASKFYYSLVQVGADFQPGPEWKRYVDAGLIPFGKLRTPSGFDLVLFTYLWGYDNESGTYTKYWDDTKVLLFSPEARADRYFGPNQRLPWTSQEVQEFMERVGWNPAAPEIPVNIQNPGNVVITETFYSDIVVAPDKKSLTLRVQHAPIFATTNTDAFVTLTVGTTS